MFDECDLVNFDNFIGYDKQRFWDIAALKHTITTPINSKKIKMISDVLLYYQFMRKNGDKQMAENFNQWVMGDFKDWRVKGYPTSNTGYTVSLAGNTTSTASTATAPVFQIKLEEDTWLSWRRRKQDPTLYPILENDQGYTD